MKLFHSPASPFVRKVIATAIELGLDDRLERLPSTASPIKRDENVAAFNPTGKVPTLIADDGSVLFDSRAICEYLDAIDGRNRIFPPPGPARWHALTEQALGDALLDAALLTRYETLIRPPELQWQAWKDGQLRKVAAALEVIDGAADGYAERFDIGTLTLACALGYLDFRFPQLEWRNRHLRAAVWFARVSERPSLRRSVPGDVK
jgi:glutathione S-transferase